MTACLAFSQHLMFVLEVRAVSFAEWRSYTFWVLLSLCVVRGAGRGSHTFWSPNSLFGLALC